MTPFYLPSHEHLAHFLSARLLNVALSNDGTNQELYHGLDKQHAVLFCVYLLRNGSAAIKSLHHPE